MTDGHDPFLRTFSDDADHPVVEVDGGDVQGGNFGYAQPACVHEFENRAVADGEEIAVFKGPHVHESVDFDRRDEFG